MSFRAPWLTLYGVEGSCAFALVLSMRKSGTSYMTPHTLLPRLGTISAAAHPRLLLWILKVSW